MRDQSERKGEKNVILSIQSHPLQQQFIRIQRGGGRKMDVSRGNYDRSDRK